MTARSSTASRGAIVERARTVARFMDRYHLDPIIGLLLPGVGDALSAGLGLYVLVAAARRGYPRAVIARMAINLGVDAGLGAIPLIGDAFDLVYKAHTRNLALLEQRDATRPATGSDWLVVAAAVVSVVAIVALPVVLAVTAIAWLW